MPKTTTSSQCLLIILCCGFCRYSMFLQGSLNIFIESAGFVPSSPRFFWSFLNDLFGSLCSLCVNWVLCLCSVEFSPCFHCVCWVCAIFSLFLLGSLDVLLISPRSLCVDSVFFSMFCWVLSMFSLCLLGLCHVLLPSSGFPQCSLWFSMCLLGSLQVLLSPLHVLSMIFWFLSTSTKFCCFLYMFFMYRMGSCNVVLITISSRNVLLGSPGSLCVCWALSSRHKENHVSLHVSAGDPADIIKCPGGSLPWMQQEEAPS